MDNKVIEHIGLVKEFSGKTMIVGIISNSGCSSCVAKNTCNVSETSEKNIEVSRFDGSYEIGEQVQVSYKESLGFFAIFIAYVFPFILVIAILVLLNYLNSNELIMGLSALGILIPYYFLLSLFKNKLKKTFSFYVRKIQSHIESPEQNG